MFKTNFLGHSTIWGGTKIFRWHCPRMYPMATGLPTRQWPKHRPLQRLPLDVTNRLVVLSSSGRQNTDYCLQATLPSCLWYFWLWPGRSLFYGKKTQDNRRPSESGQTEQSYPAVYETLWTFERILRKLKKIFETSFVQKLFHHSWKNLKRPSKIILPFE